MLTEIKSEGGVTLTLTCEVTECSCTFDSACQRNQRRQFRQSATAAGWLTTRCPASRGLMDYCPDHKKG